MAAGAGVRLGGYAISQRDNAQFLQKADNMAAQNAFIDAEGRWQQVAGIRNIGQRGFIQQGQQWVDSRLRIGSAEQRKPELQVRAFSEAHFQLAREFPEVQSLLAASDNLLVLINGHIVQIGPQGKDNLSAEDLQLLQTQAPGNDVGAAPGAPQRLSRASDAVGGLAALIFAPFATLRASSG